MKKVNGHKKAKERTFQALTVPFSLSVYNAFSRIESGISLCFKEILFHR